MSFLKYFTFEECDSGTAEFYQIIHNHTVCIEKRYWEYEGQLFEAAQNIDQVIYEAVQEKLNDPDPAATTEFLQFHYEKYLADHGTGQHFLTFLRENIWKFGLPGQRTETIETWIEAKKKELELTATGTQAANVERKTSNYITHPQQILLFHELGIIKYLKEKYNIGLEKTAEIIALLANRGKDNTGDYIRYLHPIKEKTAPSKRNMNPKTAENESFVERIIKELNHS